MEFTRSDGVHVIDEYEFSSSSKTTKTYPCGCKRSWIRYYIGEKSKKGDIMLDSCQNPHCLVSYAHLMGLDELKLIKMRAAGIKFNIRL